MTFIEKQKLIPQKDFRYQLEQIKFRKRYTLTTTTVKARLAS